MLTAGSARNLALVPKGGQNSEDKMHALCAGRAAELPTAAPSSYSCFSLLTTPPGCPSAVCALLVGWAAAGTAGRWAAAAAFAAARASGPSLSSGPPWELWPYEDGCPRAGLCTYTTEPQIAPLPPEYNWTNKEQDAADMFYQHTIHDSREHLAKCPLALPHALLL